MRRSAALLSLLLLLTLRPVPARASTATVTIGIWTDPATAASGCRGAITIGSLIVKTNRPDTVFIPYHWPDGRSANVLTHRTLDPRSKIPEYKVSACRVRRA